MRNKWIICRTATTGGISKSVGATGSGKSWLDFAYVIPKRLECVNGEGLIVFIGNTQGTLERNILEPMRELWGNSLVSSIKNDNSANIFGRKVYCLGADNKKHIDRIRGTSIEYAYGDEMTTWVEGVFQMLKSRLRCEHSVFDGTANPESPMHFIKQFIDSDADIYCQTSAIYDNPFLPEDFITEIEKEYAGTVYYKRYILGEWAAASGLIYPMYDDAVLPEEYPDLRGKFEDYALSIDYGTQNAFSAGLWGKHAEVWYRFDEYYYSGRDTGVQKTDDEYGVDIDALTEQIADKLIAGQKLKTVIDPSAASFIALLRKKGRYKVLKADNAVEDGIRETATALKTGKIKIYPWCKAWIKEAASYAWDESSNQDKPIKVNDHCLTGDTLVETDEGPRQIKKLVGSKGKAWSYNVETKEAELKEYHSVRLTQKQAPILKITTSDGKIIKCTPEHQILTKGGWKQAKELVMSDEIIVIMD